MSRIRTIKPELPQSDSFGKLSHEARLLFVQLFTIVDDEGRARGASRLLASLLYPFDTDVADHIDEWLDELDQADMARLYEVGGTRYIHLVNWLKHQKIDKPSRSRLPAFAEPSRVFANPREASATDLVSSTLDLGPRTVDQEPASPVTPLAHHDHSELSSNDAGGTVAPVFDFAVLAADAFQDQDVVDLAVEAWNELAAEFDLSQVEKVTRKRRGRVKARLHDCGGIYGWYTAIEKVRGIPGLIGKKGEGWRVNFDFLVSEEKFTKLMEGGYDGWTGSRQPAPGSTSAIFELIQAGIAAPKKPLGLVPRDFKP